MSKKHTPTPLPWRLGGISGRMIESKGHLGFIADVDLKVNAELIIKAVNNHDRLVESLEHCIQIMEDLNVPDHLMETYGNAMTNYSSFITELKSQS